MKKLTLAIALILSLTAASAAQEKIKVVTPHQTVASMVDEIGGDYVETVYLASGGRDPHMIPAKPSFIMKARQADLWIRFGMDMEIGYERLIIEGSRNNAIQVGNTGHLDLSLNVSKLEVPRGSVNRSMGDVHPHGNPHYWLDPYNGRILARSIAEKLAELIPDQVEYLIERGEQVVERIDIAMFGQEAVKTIGGDKLWQALNDAELDTIAAEAGVSIEGWYSRMKPLWGKSFVSYHKTFSYFANRFGLRVPIELEPKPGIPPGPRHVLKVIQTIKKMDISIIVIANYFNKSSAENAASKTNAKIEVLPTAVGGIETVTNYVELIDHMVDTFSKER